MKKLAILISGGGSNMKGLHRACVDGVIDAEVSVVISNNPAARGLAYAEEHGIRNFVVDHTRCRSRFEFDCNVEDVLSWFSPDYVCLAGFMRILGPRLVGKYTNKMVNIHPSLLPKHKGLNTYEKALDAGDSAYGSSVHYVTPELDAGQVIDQLQLPIHEADTVQSMKDRLGFQEPWLYVRAMRELCGVPLDK